MKNLLAGILGGLIMFVYSAVIHMALPIGTLGIKSMPNEEPVLATMKSSIPESGLYFFPGMTPGKMTKAEEDAWMARYKTGPSGLMVYHPVGGEPMTARMLTVEFLTNVLAAFVIVAFFSRMNASAMTKTLLAGGLGLFAWLSISASYWNWYGFPTAYEIAEAIEQVGGWFLAGLLLSRMVKAPRTA